LADGDKYEGEFKNGALHVQGPKHYANGSKYIGQ